jgi:hypothetical protein
MEPTLPTFTFTYGPRLSAGAKPGWRTKRALLMAISGPRAKTWVKLTTELHEPRQG